MHDLARAFAALPLLLLTWWASIAPSNGRDWVREQMRAPTTRVEGDRILVRDVRAFTWRSETDFDATWEDREYRLSGLESVWFLVAPFPDFQDAAHTWLSFGFAGGEFLAVSVEARKEKGEAYSPLGGLGKSYELIYVLADERDVVRLRTDIWGDPVYLYPVKTTPARARAALLDVLARADHVARWPEFYNSLTNNCTTAIVRHANRIAPGRVPYGHDVLFSGHSDRLALRLGLLDVPQGATLEEARKKYRIDEKARATGDRADFSTAIRQGL